MYNIYQLNFLYTKIFYCNCAVNAQALDFIFLIYWSFGLEVKIEEYAGHEFGHDRFHDRLDTCGRIYTDDMT